MVCIHVLGQSRLINCPNTSCLVCYIVSSPRRLERRARERFYFPECNFLHEAPLLPYMVLCVQHLLIWNNPRDLVLRKSIPNRGWCSESSENILFRTRLVCPFGGHPGDTNDWWWQVKALCLAGKQCGIMPISTISIRVMIVKKLNYDSTH